MWPPLLLKFKAHGIALYNKEGLKTFLVGSSFIESYNFRKGHKILGAGLEIKQFCATIVF